MRKLPKLQNDEWCDASNVAMKYCCLSQRKNLNPNNILRQAQYDISYGIRFRFLNLRFDKAFCPKPSALRLTLDPHQAAP
jgi:hypothetical protein